MSMPPNSPRLPSPPPAAEIQIGPASPSGNSNTNRLAPQIEQTLLDANSKRRVHRGTKTADMAAGPPLMPLGELDSAFQLQEHLAALHFHHSKGRTQPITRATAVQLATPPTSTDRTLWLYELCRFLISQCNSLIVGFLFDTPPCSAATCPEMRASEWQFLCAVHEQPKSCCAIDYCCHTLDWAANVVTDQNIFPSRFVAHSDTQHKNVAMKNLVNVFRRLHRIFAHAWFQHRSVFWSVEGETGLYVFFKRVCDMYDLLPGETYKLPPEAEGLEPEKPSQLEPNTETQVSAGGSTPSVNFTRSQTTQKLEDLQSTEGDGGVGRTNTRRHIRSSPSTGSAVTTVVEADEDEGAELAAKTRAMHISSTTPVELLLEEEPDAEEVPVIVEDSVMQEAAQVVASPIGDIETPIARSEDREAKLEEAEKGAEKPIAAEIAEPALLGTKPAPEETQEPTSPHAPQVEEVANPLSTASDEQVPSVKENASAETADEESASADSAAPTEEGAKPADGQEASATGPDSEAGISAPPEESPTATEEGPAPTETGVDVPEGADQKPAEEKTA